MRLLKTSSPGFTAAFAALQAAAQDTGAIEDTCRAIIAQVRTGGDAALFELIHRYDGVKLNARTLRVPPREIARAAAHLGTDIRSALDFAAARIAAFHKRTVPTGFIYAEPEDRMDTPDGDVIRLGQLVRPLERVGIYVPGGTASYPSTVLMNAMVARAAGVRDIAIATPARDGIRPEVLYAAHLAGVRTIYRMGGAQAIAALAYGTASVPRVDKIAGPGNIFVATAKRLVYGTVGIDMVAGPTEIVVIASADANPDWLAASLLAQAEHDSLSGAVLLTPSPALARATIAATSARLARLPRQDIAAEALDRRGAAIATRDLDEAFALANELAPEHLELVVPAPRNHLHKVRHAGAVFLGPHTPEPVGDYLAGPSHVLPTGGTARFASPLNVEDFVKRTSVIEYGPGALAAQAPHITALARAEGLEGHAQAILARTAPAAATRAPGRTRTRTPHA